MPETVGFRAVLPKSAVLRVMGRVPGMANVQQLWWEGGDYAHEGIIVSAACIRQRYCSVRYQHQL